MTPSTAIVNTISDSACKTKGTEEKTAEEIFFMDKRILLLVANPGALHCFSIHFLKTFFLNCGKMHIT